MKIKLKIEKDSLIEIIRESVEDINTPFYLGHIIKSKGLNIYGLAESLEKQLKAENPEKALELGCEPYACNALMRKHHKAKVFYDVTSTVLNGEKVTFSDDTSSDDNSLSLYIEDDHCIMEYSGYRSALFGNNCLGGMFFSNTREEDLADKNQFLVKEFASHTPDRAWYK